MWRVNGTAYATIHHVEWLALSYSASGFQWYSLQLSIRAVRVQYCSTCKSALGVIRVLG
nr:hypothetical protein [Escherichia coli]